jgi:hypothetical protein
VLDRHAASGELTRNAFTVLTVLYGIALILPHVSRRAAQQAFRPVSNLVMLALLAAGCLLVANTATWAGGWCELACGRCIAPVTAPATRVGKPGRIVIDRQAKGALSPGPTIPDAVQPCQYASSLVVEGGVDGLSPCGPE